MKFLVAVAALLVTYSASAGGPYPSYIWFSVKTEVQCKADGVFQAPQAHEQDMSVMVMRNSGFGNHKFDLQHLVTNFISVWYQPTNDTYTLNLTTFLGSGWNSEEAIKVTLSDLKNLTDSLPMTASSDVTLHKTNDECKVTTTLGSAKEKH